jgi:hypothetical protein
MSLSVETCGMCVIHLKIKNCTPKRFDWKILCTCHMELFFLPPYAPLFNADRLDTLWLSRTDEHQSFQQLTLSAITVVVQNLIAQATWTHSLWRGDVLFVYRKGRVGSITESSWGNVWPSWTRLPYNLMSLNCSSNVLIDLKARNWFEWELQAPILENTTNVCFILQLARISFIKNNHVSLPSL